MERRHRARLDCNLGQEWFAFVTSSFLVGFEHTMYVQGCSQYVQTVVGEWAVDDFMVGSRLWVRLNFAEEQEEGALLLFSAKYELWGIRSGGGLVPFDSSRRL